MKIVENKKNIIIGRRGAYKLKKPFIEYIYIYRKPRTPKIVINEYNALNKNDYEWAKKCKWWEGDLFLFKEYCELYRQFKLISEQYSKNKFSRNLVASNPKCCYSWLQLYNDTLIVVARSTDMAYGYKWDKKTFKYIAYNLGIKKIQIHWLNPHYYLDKTKVARRKDTK